MNLLVLTLLLSLSVTVFAKDGNKLDKWKPNSGSTVFLRADSIHLEHTQKILVISNRYFDDDSNELLLRGVHPHRQLFYFVIERSGDTASIIRCKDLASAMRVFTNDKSFLLFVNGHGKTFEQIIDRGSYIGSRYNVNMIMFDWPTEYYAIRKSIRNSRKVSNNFVTVIRELDKILKTDFAEYSSSVVFHSLGNRIIKKAVQKDLLEGLPGDMFNNVVLNAAAVKQRGHASWVDQLDIQENIYIISNKGDLPLKGVKLMRFATQLGSEYKPPLSGKAAYINLSEIATNEHNAFLGLTPVEKEHPNVFTFYEQIFNGERVDLHNPNVYSETTIPGLYYIL